MGENSNIEWTDHTFNPWRGCTKVSEGCKHCYAMTLSERYKGRHGIWGPKGTRVVASDSMWREPLKWNRDAETLGERQRVFCCSLADVFEDWQGPMSCGMKDFEGSDWEVTADETRFFVRGLRNLPMHEGSRLATMDDYRVNLWRLIQMTPMLDWLLLTKRPENIMRMVPPSWRERFPKSVWLGTSVEDQATADLRIPHLLRCPAAVRFLSCEPLLGPVDLHLGHIGKPGLIYSGKDDLSNGLHWVIVGGESGPGARPMHPDWARSLRDQCIGLARVPFFFKQWGAWQDGSGFGQEGEVRAVLTNGESGTGDPHKWASREAIDNWPRLNPVSMSKCGKHKAGRLLDGRTWDEFPEVAR